MNTRLPLLTSALFILSIYTVAAQPRQPVSDRPLKIHIIAGGEYSPVPSMTEFKKYLEDNFRVECTTSFYEGTGSPSKLDNLDGLKSADLLILFARRMSLREEQMKLIRAHWEQGKPIVGIRTACHAFQKADNEIIDRKLFGGHYGVGPSSNGGYRTAPAKGQEEHPVLKGVGDIKAAKYAYGNGDLAEGVTVLQMVGRIKDKDFPVTWVNTYKGGRYFYTSLGAPEDFQQEGMKRLLSNAAFWTTRRDPEKMQRPAKESKQL
jgi:type 1 glutamine amidotransferase